jgi:hypothetical protein
VHRNVAKRRIVVLKRGLDLRRDVTEKTSTRYYRTTYNGRRPFETSGRLPGCIRASDTFQRMRTTPLDASRRCHWTQRADDASGRGDTMGKRSDAVGRVKTKPLDANMRRRWAHKCDAIGRTNATPLGARTRRHWAHGVGRTKGTLREPRR